MATQVCATKANLISAKKSLELAKTGYELLDRKRNILVRETMGLVDTASGLQEKITTVFSEAYDALMLANVTLGVCDMLSQSVPIDDGIDIRYSSVMGVEIPTVTLKESPLENSFGFYSTNSALDRAYFKFAKVKSLMAALAQVENSAYRLADEIGKTGKRANALKNIVIPRYESQIEFISKDLEEKEIEEHSRLKIIKKRKEIL